VTNRVRQKGTEQMSLSNRGLRLAAGLLMTALLAGGISGCGFLTAAKTRADVKVGDCVVQNKDTLVVTKVACGKNDLGKIYAIPELPKGDYPGRTELDKASRHACLTASGIPSGPSTFGYFPPSEELWDQGDRELYCAAKSVAVGDCLAQDKNNLVTTVTCGKSDLGKVYAIPVLPAGKYPGDTQSGKATEDACQAAGDKLPAGTPINYLPPAQENWDAGHREVFCMSKGK
jgi:hypothetical protein